MSTVASAEKDTLTVVNEPSTSVESNHQPVKSTAVSKCVDPVLDCGNLFIEDLDPLDTERLKRNRELYLLEMARDNTQILINRIWEVSI